MILEERFCLQCTYYVETIFDSPTRTSSIYIFLIFIFIISQVKENTW